jgi:hypothetical protein
MLGMSSEIGLVVSTDFFEDLIMLALPDLLMEYLAFVL